MRLAMIFKGAAPLPWLLGLSPRALSDLMRQTSELLDEMEQGDE